jgi:3-oxoacyl-[acyl-carrier protein] reductase
MTTLEGKVVFVTGASRGIGAMTARSLLEAGASVVAHLGRSGREDDALRQTFGPNRVHTLHGDLALPGEATRLFQAAALWQGRVDVLVNNAGISPSLAFEASRHDSKILLR